MRCQTHCSVSLLRAAALLSLLFAGMQQTTAFPSWRLEEEAYTTVLLIGIRKEARSQMLHLSRNKRYTLTPEQLKWDKFKLTYKLLSYPTNLINASDSRRGIAKAFGMWSDVSPFSFREVPADQEADIKIGFYPVNHTDCLQSYLHHCFDGITGELAHAFFPPTGEIHFDDHEYWILGNMRFSWKKGVWLTDLVHVATHEIGHVLGLMHSMDPKAIMHLNATLTGRKLITQDEVWGLHRLYVEPPSSTTSTTGTMMLPLNFKHGTVKLVPGMTDGAQHVVCQHVTAQSISNGKSTVESDPGIRTITLDTCEERGCLDRLFICPAWARKGYCESKRRLMQKHCPSSCDFCHEFPFPTVAPTPTPPRTKYKLVVEGKKLTFRCGKKIASKKGKVYWYKDGELLFSHPNYVSLKDDHITIVANAINEGTYTCIVKKRDKVLTNYSWRVRVRF